MMQEEFRPILEELEAGRSAVLHRTVDGVEYTRLFRPRERLILLGGGHIAQPLCRMAAMLDFDVTVVDDRPDFAAASRFPEAAHTVCDACAEMCIRDRGYSGKGQLRLSAAPHFVSIVIRGSP